MKVAMVLPSLRNVGPVRVAFDIITSLQNADVDFTVYYMNEDSELDFPCETIKLSIKTIPALYSFDVIHSHMLKPDFINSVLPFYKGKKISTIHNIVETDLLYSHGKFLSFVFSRLWVRIWRRLDECAVLSRIAQEYYERIGLDNFKLNVIYNGVESQSKKKIMDNVVIDRIFQLKEKYTVLGTVCLFNHRKGLEQVVKALPLMQDCVFVVIGDGPVKNELISLAEKLNVSEKLVFLGFLHDATSYMALFDIYMMPSREEGFALALLDAVASNVPVACSNIPVFKEAFEPNEVAFFNLDSAIQLLDAVNLLKVNGVCYSYKAKVRFERMYTREIMASNYFKRYLPTK